MKTPLWLAVVVLLCGGILSAQSPVYKLGQTVILTVTFEGKDAVNASAASYVFRLSGARRDDQPNFDTSFGCGSASKVVAPGTLEISCKIAPNQADGEYHLLQIQGTFSNVGVNVDYQEGSFPSRKITIQNPTTFVEPKVKDVQVH